jgi:hypothetical protein
MDRLINLPDFVSKKIDMLSAAKMFKKAIDENCKRLGMDPDWETNILLYKDYNSDSNSDKIIVVSFEAGPHDWGVGYSLGSHPKSYAWPKGNPQDWYLECYYGFDVMFTPLDIDKGESYKSQYLKDGPAPNMRDKVDIVRI